MSSNNAAANTSFVATLNADGSIKISFPHANPAATWDTYNIASPTKKTITNYIFEITRLDDDGTREVIWTENIDVSQPTTVFVSSIAKSGESCMVGCSF